MSLQSYRQDFFLAQQGDILSSWWLPIHILTRLDPVQLAKSDRIGYIQGVFVDNNLQWDLEWSTLSNNVGQFTFPDTCTQRYVGYARGLHCLSAYTKCCIYCNQSYSTFKAAFNVITWHDHKKCYWLVSGQLLHLKIEFFKAFMRVTR